jgi:hypothetical protein
MCRIMVISATTICRQSGYVGRKAEVSAKEVYRQGGAVPTIWLEPLGKGDLRRLADIFNPPQNVGGA